MAKKRRSPSGTFTPQERRIFSYHDGNKTRFVDPVAIQLKIAKHIPEFQAILPAVSVTAQLQAQANENGEPFVPSEGQVDGIEKWVDLLCKVFSVERIHEQDGQAAGLSIPEINGIYTSFMRFQADLKNGSGPSLTSPTTTPVRSAGSPTTNSSQPSGSTKNGHSNAGRLPRRSASALPSADRAAPNTGSTR